MVCYYFPPLLDIGCKRSVAFAKYLSNAGWEISVVSCKKPDSFYCTLGNDKPPEGIKIDYSHTLMNLHHPISLLNAALIKLLGVFGIKVKRNFFFEIVCIPDQFIGWIPLTVLKCIKIIKTRDVDFIYVSCSPWSASFIGILLKMLTGKPLILDFRDPLALDHVPIRKKLSKTRFKINEALESWFIRKTDIFIVNTKEVKDAYEKKYSHSAGKTHFIHNGFDTQFSIANNCQLKFKKFTVIYTGEFYFYSSDYIDSFYDGMALLKANSLISPENFQFLYYGSGAREISSIAESKGLADIVESRGRIPYADVISEVSKSHLQLLRIVKMYISSKLFEGIPLNIPFLATIPQGEAEEIIKTFSPGSYIINEQNKKLVANAIVDSMDKYKNNAVAKNLIDPFLKAYSRESLTQKLIGIIETKYPFVAK
jgi:glycosyltransferase involved in cell wall biosynthesis